MDMGRIRFFFYFIYIVVTNLKSYCNYIIRSHKSPTSIMSCNEYREMTHQLSNFHNLNLLTFLVRFHATMMRTI